MMNAVKKFFNVLLIVFGILLIIVCADLLTNKLVNTQLSSLDETDRGAIEELCDMTALFDVKYGNEKVWDNRYDLRYNSAVITRTYGLVKGYTYSVNMNVGSSIFAQRLELPDKYKDIAVYRYAWLTPFTFSAAKKENGGFEQINGQRTYASVYDTQSVRCNGTGSLEEDYAKTTFSDSVESLDVPETGDNAPYEINEENVALTGLQYRLIDDMLVTDRGEKFDEMAAEYVKIREYQAAKYPGFESRRRRIELKDGCTQYAFYNISDLTGHDITYFNKEKSDSITFYSAYYYLCTGRYNSEISEFLNVSGVEYEGAALCRIINDHKIDKYWQQKLGINQNGKCVSPYTILKKYSDANCSYYYNDKSVDDIKRTYNYEEIISMARTLVRATNGDGR